MYKPGAFQSSLVIVCVIVAFAADATETENPPLEPGAHVRATVIDSTGGTAETRDVSGTLVNLDESTITMMEGKSDSSSIILRDDIADLEVRVQQGRKLMGTAIGLLVGGAFGALIGYSDGDDPPGMMSMDAGAKAATGAVFFGSIGALIGALASPGEKWQDIPSDTIQLGVMRGARGENGFVIALRF